MEEIKNQILIGLFKAIQAETDGYHFYMMAARATEDPKGREIFLQLAADEGNHLNFLKHQYNSVLNAGSPDSSLEIGTPKKLPASSPIFSEMLKTRIGGAHYEMSALSIGIQLELNAIEFYRAQSSITQNEQVKKFYSELADWEVGHYQILLKQHDYLKEDYWHSAGFAPF